MGAIIMAPASHTVAATRATPLRWEGDSECGRDRMDGIYFTGVEASAHSVFALCSSTWAMKLPISK
jgi:hypothetical protein